MFVLMLVCLTMAAPVLADGVIIVDPPSPVPPDWEPWLTIKYHRVTVSLDDQVATTRVDQMFRNDGDRPAEGTYLFPLPEGAVVQKFVMWVDGQPLESKILPADKARVIYEDYVRRQRDPALLEYVGRDAVSAHIYPIPPGKERRIQLEYTQVLPREGGLLHYVYPLDTEQFSAQPLEQVSIHVDISSQSKLRAIYSPSHQGQIAVSRPDNHQASVSYEANNVYPDRNFELYVSVSDDPIGANLLSYQPPDEDGYFLLFLTPPLKNEATVSIPRDILLVLDTSGSMEGEKLQQAKDALGYILQHLNPEDRFDVISFNSSVRTFSGDLLSGKEASGAENWVRRLEASGGTNIYQALSVALREVDSRRPTVLIFLTDGLPTEGITEEDTLLQMIAQEAPENVRIFPFGVGYDVNTLFLDQLAQDHRGQSAYVEPTQRIDEQVSAFYAKIQSPVLTDITLDFGKVKTYDVYPQPLPDLYAGSQLIVAGRYTGSGQQTLSVQGTVNGKPQQYRYQVDFSSANGAEFIPRLWAARKIGYLLTQIRLHGEKSEWVDAVTSLSLRYGIITPYTSFLIEEHEQDQVLSSEGRAQAADQFSESAPSAAVGAEAVEDAKMRTNLGNAQAPPVAATMAPPSDKEMEGEIAVTSAMRYVGDKTFLCTPQSCVDTEFVPDQMTAQDVPFMSDAYRRLLEQHPEWSAYFSLAHSVTFVAPDGQAYRFQFEGSPDELTQSGSATPSSTTAESTPIPQPPPTGQSSSPSPCSAPLTMALGAFALVWLGRGLQRRTK